MLYCCVEPLFYRSQTKNLMGDDESSADVATSDADAQSQPAKRAVVSYWNPSLAVYVVPDFQVFNIAQLTQYTPYMRRMLVHRGNVNVATGGVDGVDGIDDELMALMTLMAFQFH